MTLLDLPGAFKWTDEPCGVALKCGPLEEVARHLFTTRQLELTSEADVRLMGDAVGARRVLQLTQVHGNTVAVAREGSLPGGRPEADAVISNVQDAAVAVRAADCVPLLAGDRHTGAVAAIHAGWRGTAARAAVAAVDALARTFGSRPADLVVAIGPCIGACCYEVGPELVDAFAAAGHERYLIDRWFLSPPPPRGSGERQPLRLDLAGANRDQLVLAGVPENQIHVAGLCTAEHLDVLTSYRVEKQKAGRIAGVIRAGSGQRLTSG